MRVAIIGYSGAGRTTLANALAGVLGARRIQVLEEAWMRPDGAEDLVLDGVPNTVAEFAHLDSHSGDAPGIDRVLYLRASSEIRLARIARMVVAGTRQAHVRDRLMHPADLEKARRYLDSTGRLTVIDAARSRTEVLADALDALGIRI